jgi:hypothetical protein
MKLNVMFIIAAIWTFFLGFYQLLAPAAITNGALNTSSPVSLSMAVVSLGVANLSIGIIALLVRNTEVSKIRDSITLGFTIIFALRALAALYGQSLDPMNLFWIVALTETLIAFGFFLAGRISALPVIK